MAESPADPGCTVLPRLRVLVGGEIALGPGKVALLEAIEAHGTLAQAADALDMSYMRAWKLVQTMNVCFRGPLVETARGGRGKGSARLTPLGREVARLYRRMEAESLQAVSATWTTLRASLAGSDATTLRHT